MVNMKKIFIITTIMSLVSLGFSNLNAIDSSNLRKRQNNIPNAFEYVETKHEIRFIDYFDGYVYYTTEIYRANFTNKSSIYLFSTDTTFVPGRVANSIDSKYHSDNYLSEGFISFSFDRFEDSSLGVHMLGANTKLLYAYPNEPSKVQTTVSSHFGTELSIYNELEGGVEFNGGLSVYVSKTIGASLSFSLDTTITSVSEDPLIAPQFYDDNTFYWNIQFVNPSYTGSMSYKFHTYVFLEVDNYSYACPLECFNYTYSVSFRTKYKLLFMEIEEAKRENSYSDTINKYVE